jgi:hypothetical protein
MWVGAEICEKPILSENKTYLEKALTRYKRA